jgi:hypothetical protein
MLGSGVIEYISQGGLLVVGAMATYLAFKYFKGKIPYHKVTNPRNHLFFSKIQYEKIAHLPSIRLKHNGVYAPNRTTMFTNMLDDKFDIWNKYVWDMINEALRSNANDYDLEILNNKCIKNIIIGCESKWKETGIDKDVIKKFNLWHSEHIKLLIETIGFICLGDSYSSIEEKLNAILEIHKVLIIITIVDVEKTLGNMNGSLSGKKYKKLILE